MDQVRDQALGRFVGLDCSLDRIRGDAAVDGVVARAVQARNVELGGAFVERWQRRRTIESQSGRHPGDRRTHHCLADVKVTQIDLYGQIERPAARGLAFRLREPNEI